jgi:hypothetical protein
MVSTCTVNEASNASLYGNATQVRHTRLSGPVTGTKSCNKDESKMTALHGVNSLLNESLATR